MSCEVLGGGPGAADHRIRSLRNGGLQGRGVATDGRPSRGLEAKISLKSFEAPPLPEEAPPPLPPDAPPGP